MYRTRTLVGAFALIVFTAGLLVGQEKKDEPVKVRGQLPAGWKKLGLSDSQRTKIYTIQSDYRARIDTLEKQLAKLKEQQRIEMEKVLTDAQKAELRKLLSDKVPADTKDSKSSPGKKDKK